MSDLKVNSVGNTCPSFYKEKVKESHKVSKLVALCKKVVESLRGKK